MNKHNSKYNFQQRISWLSHRWRTQRNAIRNVNCRIQWIIESLNAHCALWYSGEHACLSISKTPSVLFLRTGLESSQRWFQNCWRVAWNAGAAGHIFWAISITYLIPSDGLFLLLQLYKVDCPFARLMQKKQREIFVHSISNQVRLPAELKHINKRRKRN
jgi:hypothetical protein